MKIAVDFDGTCVTHTYPFIGKDIGAAPVLNKLIEAGHALILYTMRSGAELADAQRWFSQKGLPLSGINSDPGQSRWTESSKCFANLYIDDSALGCPLAADPEKSERPFVDWGAVESMLKERHIIS
jgi:hypothetical protein